MRISDWSSDVCSSYLRDRFLGCLPMTPQSTAVLFIAEAPPRRWQERYDAIFDAALAKLHSEGRYRVFIDILRNKGSFPDARCFAGQSGPKRSEEHTSELQSLMRISYAGICFKQQKQKLRYI